MSRSAAKSRVKLTRDATCRQGFRQRESRLTRLPIFRDAVLSGFEADAVGANQVLKTDFELIFLSGTVFAVPRLKHEVRQFSAMPADATLQSFSPF